jgi:hypothetical protein
MGDQVETGLLYTDPLPAAEILGSCLLVESESGVPRRYCGRWALPPL